MPLSTLSQMELAINDGDDAKIAQLGGLEVIIEGFLCGAMNGAVLGVDDFLLLTKLVMPQVANRITRTKITLGLGDILSENPQPRHIEALMEVSLELSYIEGTFDHDDDLERTICRQALLLTLARSYESCFKLSGDLDSLDRAIKYLSILIPLCSILSNSAFDTPLFRILGNLGSLLSIRFQLLGRMADIQASILNIRRAIESIPDGHDDKPILHCNLGHSFLTRFQHRGLGDVEDLHSAIKDYETALHLMPDDYHDRYSLHNSLAICFDYLLSSSVDIKYINHLVEHRKRVVDLTVDGHPEKPSRYNDLGNAYLTRFEQLNNDEDAHHAINYHEQALELTPDGHPNKSLYHNSLGNSLLARFDSFEEVEDVHRAIKHHERSLGLTPDGHPEKPSRHSDLGESFHSRSRYLSDDADIHLAIKHHEQAVQLTKDNHPDKPSLLDKLGSSLRTRFDHLGNIEDLDCAVKHHERVVELTPDGHEDKLWWHSILATSYLARFNAVNDVEDIHRTIEHETQALRLTKEGHPANFTMRESLAEYYLARFDCLDNVEDIHCAIDHCEQAVKQIQETHRSDPSMHNMLGNAYFSRFTRLGNVEDAHRAIKQHERAVELTPEDDPYKHARYNDLGESYLIRFENLGSVHDLHHAVKQCERAMKLTPDSHPDKPSRHNSLGNCYLSRFHSLGDIEDIHRASKHYEQAVELSSNNHPSKPTWHNNLGVAYITRFDRLSDIEDIHRAMIQYERAVELTPNGDPGKPSSHSNLGNTYVTRFNRLGDVEDLRRATRHLKQAVDLISEDHSSMPSVLNSLGNAYTILFDRLHNTEDINCATKHLERAVDITPDDHPSKPSRRNDLGSCFITRFKHLGDITDIHCGIKHHERAVETIPPDHPSNLTCRINLGLALSDRFHTLEQQEDIDRAVELLREVVKLTPSGHAEEIRYSLSLSQSLLHRGGPDDLSEAINLVSQASKQPYSSPQLRFHAATHWAEYLLRRDSDSSSPSLLEAYRVAIELLPRLSWVGSNIPTRFHQLSYFEAPNTASNAAAVAIATGNPELAVEWLEQGRSVVWAQTLQMRTPLEQLESSHLDHARRLRGIWDVLDSHKNSTITPNQRIELALEEEKLIDQVRCLPGFGRFLLPQQYSDLQHAARHGPVILLNASEYRCDALILTSSSVHPIHLSNCAYKVLRDIQGLFRCALEGNEFRGEVISRSFPNNPWSNTPSRKTVFKLILDWLWFNVVEPCVVHLASLLDTKELMHIRWCPTGAFTFLPIHAAAAYTKEGADFACLLDSSIPDFPRPLKKRALVSLSDHAISSYTPTLSVLLPRPDSDLIPESSHIQQCKVLAVIQPDTPDAPPLPGTMEELDMISKHTSESGVVLTSLVGGEATVERVVKEMTGCSIVHFACHGVQDESEPLNSGLLLDNGCLTLSQLMHTKLDKAQLAFLSACETAKGDENLPDEAMHLAGGMLAAGFESVIATMWTIHDSAAPIVADQVYAELLKDGNLRSGEVAEALHHAIQHLKLTLPDFMSWVPFVHLGI